MPSITIIVPALNEEGNLEATVNGIVPLLGKWFEDYEIFLFDDGSSDQTGAIAERLAAQNKKIKVIHNLQPMGLGYNYKKGVKLAEKDYVMMVPGDNDILRDSFEGMFKRLGEKEIIIPYTGNMEIRPLGRRMLSKAFTNLMNFLFGLKLRYFNGVVIHKRALIQSIQIQTDSFAYQAEALIKLIRSGHSYLELPQFIRERKHGKSKALRFSNLWRVFKTVGGLFCQIHFSRRKTERAAERVPDKT